MEWAGDLEEEYKLNIAVLSGKGGTGKTTVSTNLAELLNANYIDCDVEEPDGFIFLHPEDVKSKEVEVEYPYIDNTKCTLCGECAKVCQFNALARTKNKIILFEKLCHGCGACHVACKYDAVFYRKRVIGVIEEGRHKGAVCKRGVLNIGEPMAVPVIRELLKQRMNGVNILDCCPGTSCNVVNTLHYSDAAILVTEPTEFGLHDLKLAVKLVEEFKIPFGIVINKYTENGNITEEFCRQRKIPVLGTIPYSRDTAAIYSSGSMLVDREKYRKIFDRIANAAKEVFPWNL